MFKNSSLKLQILVSFTVFATISLLIVSIFSSWTISNLGNQTGDLSNEKLENQALRNMNMSVTEVSHVIERKMDKLLSVVKSIASLTESFFQEPSSLGIETSYFDYNTSALPTDSINSSKYNNTLVSFSHSTFYIPGSNPSNIDSLMTPQMSQIINRSAHLDTYFKSQFTTNENFYWLFVGFSAENVLRVFPGTQWDEDRIYNHQNEVWYTDALIANGNLILTDPYKESVGNNWIITIAKAIYYQNGDLLGVVAGDVLIDDIQQKVLSLSYLKTGYATFIQDNDLVVAHPNWKHESASNPVNILELEDLSPEILQNIKNSEQLYLISMIKSGKHFFMASSLILDQYFLLMFVAQNEVFQNEQEIAEQIEEKENQVIAITILVSVITLFVVLVIGSYFMNRFTKPLNTLNELATKISNNIIDDTELQDVTLDIDIQRDDEVGGLSRAFSGMIDYLNESHEKSKTKT